MSKLCECGCGEPAPIGQRTQKSRGLVVGQPLRFVSGHQNRNPFEYDVIDCGYETPCWVVQGRRGKFGYATIHRDGKKYLAHRWYYERAVGPIPAGMFVCHKCDNRPCVRPDHLFVGTCADNVHDMVAKGRNRYSGRNTNPARGERHCKAVLTEATVREIWSRYHAGGVSERKLAASLGVSRGAVSRVLRRTAWCHVDL